MKTILIPTDFSEASKNAAAYAVELGKQMNARLILLHVFQIPVIAADVPIVVPSYTEIEKESLAVLKELERQLYQQHNYNETIETIVNPGLVIDEIESVATEKKVDLIVMGITGSGKISELMGSNSTGVIKNLNFTTLIVPQQASYKPFNNIVFACDLNKIKKETPALTKIKSFVRFFKSKLLIINILSPMEKPTYDKAISSIQLGDIFESINYSLHFPENEDMVEAINNFTNIHKADLLIMIPKKYPFFKQLFHKSNTKKMAFHTNVPLLVMHD